MLVFVEIKAVIDIYVICLQCHVTLCLNHRLFSTEQGNPGTAGQPGQSGLPGQPGDRGERGDAGNDGRSGQTVSMHFKISCRHSFSSCLLINLPSHPPTHTLHNHHLGTSWITW